jgi:hypothetical protein
MFSVTYLVQRTAGKVGQNVRAFSSKASTDPTALVSNVTSEHLAVDNPELEAFLKANFPQDMDPMYEPDKPPHCCKVNNIANPMAPAKPATEEVFPRNIRPLTSYLRDANTEQKSRPSRKLRHDLWIPGILYGGDPTRGIYSHQPESKTLLKTRWHLLEREWDRFRDSIESRVYELSVLNPEDDSPAMEPQLVVPANVQRHPVLEKMLCINYLRYHPGRPLKLPLVHMNQEESPALKREGYLIPIQRTVEVFVDADVENIPSALELECTGLQFKDVVRTDRLILPPGVRLSDRVLKRGDDYIIAVVDGRSRGADE